MNVDPTAELPPMRQLSVTYHEMVKDFQAGGFSRKEAMQFALQHFAIVMEHGMNKGEENDT